MLACDGEGSNKSQFVGGDHKQESRVMCDRVTEIQEVRMEIPLSRFVDIWNWCCLSNSLGFSCLPIRIRRLE